MRRKMNLINVKIVLLLNYNNVDKGILLLNEKFALIITKKIFDMINNNNI